MSYMAVPQVAKDSKNINDRENWKQKFNNVKSHYYNLFDDVRNFTINEKIDKFCD